MSRCALFARKRRVERRGGERAEIPIERLTWVRFRARRKPFATFQERFPESQVHRLDLTVLGLDRAEIPVEGLLWVCHEMEHLQPAFAEHNLLGGSERIDRLHDQHDHRQRELVFYSHLGVSHTLHVLKEWRRRCKQPNLHGDLGVGCWVLGDGCWEVSVGCWVWGVGCWVLGVGC